MTSGLHASRSPVVRFSSFLFRPRRVRGRVVRGTLAALALSVSTASVAAPPTIDPQQASGPIAVLLVRIQQAAQRENYAGTFVHQQANQVQSTRITHVVDKSGEHEKLELLDGQEREFVRHGEDVKCYVPDRKLILVEKRAKYDSFPALLTGTPSSLESLYEMSSDGADRIAGRPVVAIRLKPRDDRRYGFRLWYDRDTHLLMKAQTLSDKGGVIEQVSFTDIVIGAGVDPAKVRPTATSTEGWRTEVSSMVPADLARDGWSIAQPVEGFRKVMEVKRAFGARSDVGQIVYSDGLSTISVFIEPGIPPGGVEGDAAKGPIHVVTRKKGDYWLTIVGDAPGDSVRRMAAGVTYAGKSAR